ncbi:glycosyltransferase [Paenibacillus vini]|nr:hypothetical protein [Paenibacillus vini]
MDKSKPRLLWVCSHLVLRYEEIPLLIEAGAEVIPSLGKERYHIEFDSQYDNETDGMYPDWRSHCSLPANIVDKIRTIDLEHPTPEEADFMNSWIDAIYIASFPRLAEGVLQWFQGVVIYRVFGDTETYTNISITNGVDLNTFGDADNYVWSPILKCLNEHEDDRIAKRTFYLPAFVSKSRLPFEWAGEGSERTISTQISYIHKSPFYEEKYEIFKKAFHHLDYIVLGRNDKKSPLCHDNKILGNVDFTTLMQTLCNTRIFCYGGALIPTHLHFTPIEALAVNVPVLFAETSGFARELLENGLHANQLKELGMCKDYYNMAEKAAEYLDDFSVLVQLQEAQQQHLLPVFSRDRALSSAEEFIKGLRDRLGSRRSILPYNEVYSLEPGSPIKKQSMTSSLEMPALMGEYRIWSGSNFHGSTGSKIYNPRLQTDVRQARTGIDAPGLLIDENIYLMPQGVYEFTFSFHFEQPYSEPAGEIIIGSWNPDYVELLNIRLLPALPGLNIYKGIVEINESLITAWKKLRVTFSGHVNTDFVNLRVIYKSDRM